jgi:histidine triad (HIT) family protein
VDDCIFCQIIQRRAPGSIVYEDELAVAFLDIHPINPGDTMVVPRVHVVDMFEADADLIAHLFRVAKRLLEPIRQVSGCPGMNVIVANGHEAYQDVFHLHVHLTPRRRGDGFIVRFPDDFPPPLDRAEMDRVASKIRQALETQCTSVT